MRTRLNQMPPGQAGEGATPRQGSSAEGFGAADFSRGFERCEMTPGEPARRLDLHERVTVDGVTGFLERGNLLDRM